MVSIFEKIEWFSPTQGCCHQIVKLGLVFLTHIESDKVTTTPEISWNAINLGKNTPGRCKNSLKATGSQYFEISLTNHNSKPKSLEHSCPILQSGVFQSFREYTFEKHFWGQAQTPSFLTFTCKPTQLLCC